MGGNCCDNKESIYLSDIIYDCEEFQCPGFPELSLTHCKDMCYVIDVIMTAICDLKSAVGFTNVNVGGGQQVFKNSVGAIENFRTLVAGASGDITVTTVGDTIEIEFAGADLNTTYDLTSVQNGSDSDITLTGSDATTDIVKLVAGTNITLTDTGSNITIDAATGGEANTASNVGAGTGLPFKIKNGVDLEFRTLLEGYGTDISTNVDDVAIGVDLTNFAIEFGTLGIVIPAFTTPPTVANQHTPAQYTIPADANYHINITGNCTLNTGDEAAFYIIQEFGGVWSALGQKYPHTFNSGDGSNITWNFSLSNTAFLNTGAVINLGFEKTSGTPTLNNICLNVTRID